ncbi:MAG: hypothetical protein ACRDP7_16695, partial [Trebonia sp.]
MAKVESCEYDFFTDLVDRPEREEIIAPDLPSVRRPCTVSSMPTTKQIPAAILVPGRNPNSPAAKVM